MQENQASKHSSDNSHGDKLTIKTTPRRYIILLLFCLISANKSFQWLSIPAGTKKIAYYYGVQNYVINGISVIYLIALFLLTGPACLIINSIGLRKTTILAISGASVGAALKCFGCTENGVVILFVAQALVASCEQLIYSAPSRLVSLWFPDGEISRALSVSMMGTQLGNALAFLVSQQILDGAQTRAQIGQQLQLLFNLTALFTFCLAAATWALFEEAPESPPGEARRKQLLDERARAKLSSRQPSTWDYAQSLGRECASLLANRQFVVMNLSSSLVQAINMTNNSNWNQMMAPFWPNDDAFVGLTGSCCIVFGIAGSIIWGHVLDRTRKYKWVNAFLLMTAILAHILLAYAENYVGQKWAIYLASAVLGFFQTGLLVTNMELAIELTYPASQLVTASLMNLTPNIVGTVSIFVASHVVDTYGQIAASSFYIACFALALIMYLCIEETLKRQEAAGAGNISANDTAKVAANINANAAI